MWPELVSDLAPLHPALPWQQRPGVTTGGWADQEGGSLYISSSLTRYERVGHVNWAVTHSTTADKERAMC